MRLEMGSPLRREEGLVFLSRCHICCTVIQHECTRTQADLIERARGLSSLADLVPFRKSHTWKWSRRLPYRGNTQYRSPLGRKGETSTSKALKNVDTTRKVPCYIKSQISLLLAIVRKSKLQQQHRNHSRTAAEQHVCSA
jgi:hypothetical protein